MRPASMTSMAGLTTVPPAASAAAIEASTSSTLTKVLHIEGMPAMFGGCVMIPQTGFPFDMTIV